MSRGPVHRSRCSHFDGMLYDDDFCCCKRCGQQWFLEVTEEETLFGHKTKGKWIPYVNGKPFVQPFKAKTQRKKQQLT